MYIIITDVQITRRKRVHMIVNTDGNLQLAATTLAEAFTWLLDNGHLAVLIEAGLRQCYQLELRHIGGALTGYSQMRKPEPS